MGTFKMWQTLVGAAGALAGLSVGAGAGSAPPGAIVLMLGDDYGEPRRAPRPRVLRL